MVHHYTKKGVEKSNQPSEPAALHSGKSVGGDDP